MSFGTPHPITGRFIEDGSGALPRVQQLRLHLAAIAAERGQEEADHVSKGLEAHEPEWKKARDAERKAAADEAERLAAEQRHQERVARALELLDAKEAAEKEPRAGRSK